MASEELKSALLKLILGKPKGASRQEVYSIAGVQVEIAHAVNELSKQGLIVRVGSGKTSMYYDAKFNSSEVCKKLERNSQKNTAEKGEKGAEKKGAEKKAEREWPLLHKGTRKAQIAWLYKTSEEGLTNEDALQKYKECSVNERTILTRNSLAVYCHALIREGFIVRIGRGVHKYCGPDKPFDDSKVEVFKVKKVNTPEVQNSSPKEELLSKIEEIEQLLNKIKNIVNLS